MINHGGGVYTDDDAVRGSEADPHAPSERCEHKTADGYVAVELLDAFLSLKEAGELWLSCEGTEI